MDFTNYKFRCHSLGKLMTGVKDPLTAKQEAEMIRLLENQKSGKITEKQTITLGQFLEKKHSPEKLSVTTQNYLKEIHREELLKRSKNLTNKYCDKGIRAEEKNITLYSNVTDKLFIKNKVRFTNEYLSGEPDNVQGKVRDMKSSWDYSTFPFYADDIPTSDYEWQLHGYMALTGLNEAELIYGLVDTPYKIINDELRRLDWKEDIMDNEGDIRKEHIDLVVETVSNLIYTEKGLEEFCQQSTNVRIEWFQGKFSEIHESLRVKVFHLQKDDSKIQMLYSQIEKCRNYLNDLSLTIAETLQVA